VFKAITPMDDIKLFATGGTGGELTIWDSDNLTEIARS